MKAVVGCPKGKFSGGKCSVGTQVQTLIFPKSAGWTSDKAKSWLKSHDMKTGLDTTDDSFRARQKNPGSFDSDSFRTISFGQSKGEEARDWLEAHHMSTHQFDVKEAAYGGLVPFKARVLAAVPGKSLNNRTYTRELLQQAAPFYEGKPFIMDHNIEDVNRVIGIFSRPRYSNERGMDGGLYEGLWLDAVGLMEPALFDKVKGTGLVPPLVRGFSIGGIGEGDFGSDGGIILKKFIPAEGSMTAFPGIPAAHIATINAISESIRRHEHEVKQTSIPVKEMEVSLDEAGKQAVEHKRRHRVSEGPIPPADNANSVRGVRGLYPATNDTRPGIPAPTSRRPVSTYNQMGTTSSDGNAHVVNPEDSRAGGKFPRKEAAPGSAGDAGAQGSKDAKVFKRKDPSLGQPTKHPGFGKLGPSGTGLPDGEEEEEEEMMQGSKDMDNPHMMKSDKAGSKFQRKDAKLGQPTRHPGFGKMGPSGTGLPDQPDEEEEEEEETQRFAVKMQSKDDDDGDDDKDEDEEEEEEEEEEHGPSPHTPGLPVGKRGGHSAPDAYDSPSDKDSDQAGAEEEEEEESRPKRLRIKQDDSAKGADPSMNPFEPKKGDGVTTNPILKTAGQGDEEEEEEEEDNVGANPVRDGKTMADGDAEEEEEEEERRKATRQGNVLFSEGEPIQGKAFSLPTNSGILATLASLHGAETQKAKEALEKGSVEELVKALTMPDKYVSSQQVSELLMAWNKGKTPKEEPPRKIVIRKPTVGSSKDISIPDARRPPEIAENVVRTKTLTNIAPTVGATSVSTLPMSRLQELFDAEKKKPYSNVSYLNPAKRAWNRAVQDLINFQ